MKVVEDLVRHSNVGFGYRLEWELMNVSTSYMDLDVGGG